MFSTPRNKKIIPPRGAPGRDPSAVAEAMAGQDGGTSVAALSGERFAAGGQDGESRHLLPETKSCNLLA